MGVPYGFKSGEEPEHNPVATMESDGLHEHRWDMIRDSSIIKAAKKAS